MNASTSRPMSEPHRLANRNLLLLMAHKGCTQEDVADALGVDQSVVSRLLSGDRRWKVEDLGKLLKFFDLDDASVWFEEVTLTWPSKNDPVDDVRWESDPERQGRKATELLADYRERMAELTRLRNVAVERLRTERGMSYAEVATAIGLSKSRVAQIGQVRPLAGVSVGRLAEVINDRMYELLLSQQEVARRSGLSLATVKALCRGEPRVSRVSTVRRLEEALEWPSGTVEVLLAGTRGEAADVHE